MTVDVGAILGYGVVGLGFLLCLLTYALLRNDTQVGQRIYVFIAFSLVIVAAGFAHEYIAYQESEQLIELQQDNRDLRRKVDILTTDLGNANTKSSGDQSYYQTNFTALDKRFDDLFNNLQVCINQSRAASTNTADHDCSSDGARAMVGGQTAWQIGQEIKATLKALSPR